MAQPFRPPSTPYSFVPFIIRDDVDRKGVFAPVDFVIANGTREELGRIRRKITLAGGTIRINFSRAIKYYIVPYGKTNGSMWKDKQAKLFGLEPIDERFIDECISVGRLVPHRRFAARFLNKPSSISGDADDDYEDNSTNSVSDSSDEPDDQKDGEIGFSQEDSDAVDMLLNLCK
jgi:hypothetical protein